MKTNIFLSIISIFLFTSCYTTRITQEFLKTKSQNQELLSQLRYSFNEESFFSVFTPTKKIIDEEFVDGISEKQREVSFINESRSSDDVKTLVRRYIDTPDSRIESGIGEIVFSVTFFDCKTNYFLWALSALTFGALNLVGLPTGQVLHTIELEAAIYNNSGKLVHSYSGFGRDKFLTGLYYYSSNQKRASFIKSTKNALTDIDLKINADQEFLLQQLLEKQKILKAK